MAPRPNITAGRSEFVYTRPMVGLPQGDSPLLLNTSYTVTADIEVPQDLADALRADPRAEATFGTLTRANRYAVLYRIGNARKPETRARRIAQFVDMLARGETIHPKAP